MANNNFLGSKNLNSYPNDKNNPNMNLSPNYSGLQQSANNLVNTESQVGKILSNLDLGGSIGDEAYNLGDTTSEGVGASDSELSGALDALGNDITETQNMMNNIQV